eukprot:Skav216423  [mRNA]  locus=scaffold3139:147083:159330:- [translate_table: standard]
MELEAGSRKAAWVHSSKVLRWGFVHARRMVLQQFVFREAKDGDRVRMTGTVEAPSTEEEMEMQATSDETRQQYRERVLQDSAEVAPTPGEAPRGHGLRQALCHLRFQLPSFEGDGLQQVLTALTSLSELLPLCMCPGVMSWKQVADSSTWPWRGTDEDAPGWSELKDRARRRQRIKFRCEDC